MQACAKTSITQLCKPEICPDELSDSDKQKAIPAVQVFIIWPTGAGVGTFSGFGKIDAGSDVTDEGQFLADLVAKQA